MARPIGVDLFSGAGGLSLGFEQAGFDVAAAVEIDPIHAAAHKYNFPRCTTICESVENLTGEQIRDLAGLRKRSVDVVFGGAPCQGFSMIGKRALDDPRNSLVKHFVRLVVELNAKYFVFENVKGLTLGKHRSFLDEICSSLKEAGYSVVDPYRVLNAADFGVPQNRHRLFLMGCKKGLKLPKYPSATSSTHVIDAIGDLPDADSFEELWESDEVKVRYKKRSKYASILRGEIEDATDFSYRRAFDRNLLTSSLRTEHTSLSKKRFSATPQGETEPISRFFKLHPDGLCNTLRAGTDTARGAFTSPRPIHPFYSRVITVREAARLHSYPDWFRFHITKWHGFRQVGNSVPPLLAKSVANEVLIAGDFEADKPRDTLHLDQSDLLRFDMSEAVRYFELRGSPIASRQRAIDAPEQLQLGIREKRAEYV